MHITRSLWCALCAALRWPQPVRRRAPSHARWRGRNAVARWHTIEDGPPRTGTDRWMLHDMHGPTVALEAMQIRNDVTWGLRSEWLVIQATKATGAITAKIAAYQPPSDEDGA